MSAQPQLQLPPAPPDLWPLIPFVGWSVVLAVHVWTVFGASR